MEADKIFDNIFKKLEELLRAFFTDSIIDNITHMFSDVNSKIGEIASEVGKTPQSYNGGVFSMIKGLSDTVVVPIAGMIISAVLCYELITMITDKNNLSDGGTYVIFKFIFKACVAVWFVSHTFDISMAIFDLGKYIVDQAAGFLGGDTAIDITASIATLSQTLEDMDTAGLFALMLETMILQFAMKVITILISVLLINRMMTIYIYCSVAPVPFATLANREWGTIGTNYVKGLAALGFQGFFIMVIVKIYAKLVQTIDLTGDLHIQMLVLSAYTIALCLSLFKSDSISRSVFHAQ
jgi:hypothetical protein